MHTVLAVDVGNTNTKWGWFRDGSCVQQWSTATRVDRTADEIGDELAQFFRAGEVNGHGGIVISSVVPTITPALAEACRTSVGTEPLIIGPGSVPELLSSAEFPVQIGSDRIAAMVGAIHLYGPPLIVMTLGTANTFSVVDADGKYLGGVIAPGLGISLDALTRGAAQLPDIQLTRPQKLIAGDTEESIRSGAFFGFLGQIEGIVERIRREHRLPFQHVATGGLASLAEGATPAIHHVHPHLILEGLRVIWEKSQAT